MSSPLKLVFNMGKPPSKEILGIGFIVMIDNHIFETVKTLQQNAHTLSKISKDEFIELYKMYGLHKLEFDRIFS